MGGLNNIKGNLFWHLDTIERRDLLRNDYEIGIGLVTDGRLIGGNVWRASWKTRIWKARGAADSVGKYGVSSENRRARRI